MVENYALPSFAAKTKTPHVIVVGAGTGGLCLAHGLKAAGIPVQVFERDRSPFDRTAGYRLSINPTGNRALRECLSAPHFEKLVQCSVRPARGVSFLDERLRALFSRDLPVTDPDSVDSERPISRIALRRVLLEGLDDVVRFGKKFHRFEDAANGQITVHFEDGSSASGDLVVGADGASSRVRSQLLPHAQRIETGILAVSGKLKLDPEVRAMTPAPVFRGPTLILGPKGCFLFANAVEYEAAKDEISNSGKPGAGSSFADREEYVMWAFSARREKFGPLARANKLHPEELKTAAIGLMKNWNPELRRLVQQSSDLGLFSVKTSVPVSPWETRNVTLLGDALHNMTPFRGMGGNMALRDAAALTRALVKVTEGETPLLEALAQYEREMIEIGFRAVRLSLENMERVHSEGIRKVFAKLALRVMNSVPTLKERFAAG